MSFGGILATALAGGAGVIGKQAGDDIEAQRKADMLKQQADIEFQTQQRLAEMRQRMSRDQLTYETTGEGGAAKLDFARRTGEQATDLAIKGKVAEATNPELAAAKDTQAEAELQREIRRIQATAKPEAEKAAAIAEARAKMEAKYRAPKEPKQTMADKVTEVESVIGRKLTQQEREQMAGVGKGGDDGLSKWMRGLVEEEVKAGSLPADKAAERLSQIEAGFGAIRQESAIRTGVAQARKDGKTADAISELRSKGLDDAALRKFFTADELKATQPAKPDARKPMLSSVGAPAGPAEQAKAAVREAQAAVQAYGSVQRQRDPQGFEAAKRRLEQARAALQEAEAGSVSAEEREAAARPSVRYAAP